MSKRSKPETHPAKEPDNGNSGRPRRRYSRRAGDFQKPEGNSKIWLTSFTDVVALMLTFFVLLFAMSQPSQEEWSEVSAALQNEFSTYYGPQGMSGPVEQLNLDRIDFDDALNIQYLRALLEAIIADNETLSGVRLFSRPGQLIVSLPQELLFAPGQSAVQRDGARALYALGGAMTRIKNKIEVTGHADPRPVGANNDRYKSNWELSFARAANVAGILNAVGYERSIDIRGMASGRYGDLHMIADEQTRLDLSRRVDIIIKDHDGRERNLPFAPIMP